MSWWEDLRRLDGRLLLDRVLAQEGSAGCMPGLMVLARRSRTERFTTML